MNSKVAKKKAREERLRVQKHNEFVQNLYPKIVFINEQYASKELVNEVKKYIDLIKFREYSIKQSVKTEVFFDILKLIRKKSFSAFLDCYEKIDYDSDLSPESNLYMNLDKTVDGAKLSNESLYVHSFLLSFGTYIHNNIKENVRKKHLPFEYFRILFLNNQIAILFYKIETKKTPFGTIYHLNNAAVICHENKKFKVAFSTHAMQRHLDRHSIDENHNSFINQDNFYETLQMSKIILNKNNSDNILLETHIPIVSMNLSQKTYNWLCSERNSKNMPKMGNDLCTDYMMFVRLFYSPVRFENDYAVMLTCLLPGYKGTPEYNFWKTTWNLTKKDYFRIKNYFDQEFHKTCDNLYKKILIIFHKHGLHQFHDILIEKSYFSGKLSANYLHKISDYIQPNSTKLLSNNKSRIIH